MDDEWSEFLDDIYEEQDSEQYDSDCLDRTDIDNTMDWFINKLL